MTQKRPKNTPVLDPDLARLDEEPTTEDVHVLPFDTFELDSALSFIAQVFSELSDVTPKEHRGAIAREARMWLRQFESVPATTNTVEEAGAHAPRRLHAHERGAR